MSKIKKPKKDERYFNARKHIKDMYDGRVEAVKACVESKDHHGASRYEYEATVLALAYVAIKNM